MKRRILYDDKKAVSNVLAYLFSFTIASMVMVSSVIITTNIINDKTADVAGLEAQSLANKIADALIEAVGSRQSGPDSDYEKILDVPRYLAGLSYYIEVTESVVYVNTTDGRVSKSCTTYNAGNLSIGVSSDGKIYGGSGKIDISFDEPDYVYKFDFGTGNSFTHSPVESGYYMITGESTDSSMGDPESKDLEWLLGKYHYRTPILVENPSSEGLTDVPVRIVLNPSNFDYNYANVSSDSSSSAFSDITFFEPAGMMDKVTINISIDPVEWDPRWFYIEQTGTIDVTITDFSGGYTAYDIDEDTLMLNDQVSSISFDKSTKRVTFDRREALQSLEDEDNFLRYVGDSGYEVTLSGSFKNGMTFNESAYISIIKDLYVDIGGGAEYTSIQSALDDATEGDTIFVYTGTYEENIVIYKQIGLIGENKATTIIDGLDGDAGDHVVDVNVDDVYIDSFSVRGGDGGVYEGDGIYLNGWSDFRTGITIRNCNVYNNKLNGIRLYKANENTIINCDVYWNGNNSFRNGILLVLSDSNNIINCNVHHQEGPGSVEEDEYPDGIDIRVNSDYNLIENCNVHDMTDDGIDFDELSDHNTVRNCSIYNNGARGIQFQQDDGYNTITNCSIYSNDGPGILAYESDGNTIENCEIYQNILDGIYILSVSSPCEDNKITNCNIYGNGNDGVSVIGKTGASAEYCEYTTIEYCDIYDNGDDGISITDCRLVTVSNCDIYDNGYGTGSGVGIWLCRSGKISGSDEKPCYIIDCNVYNNSNDGVRLDGSWYNQIKGCNMFDNGDDGLQLSLDVVWVVHSRNNLIEYCSFYSNTGTGLYIAAGSHTNDIYHNNFRDNKAEGYETACDNCLTENDYDGNDNKGNYWSDWDGWGGQYLVPRSLPGAPQIDSDPHDTPYALPCYIQVDDSYTSTSTDYYHVNTIQEGINRVHHGASSPSTGTGLSKWGTVKVHAGTYDTDNGDVFPIRVNKSYVKLIGGDVSLRTYDIDTGELVDINYTTKIYGESNKDVIKVTRRYVSIQNFTIKDGKKGITFDLAVWVIPYYIRITNCSVKDNTEDGIYLNYSSMYNNPVSGDEPAECITNCLFRNNDNGIYLEDSADNNKITNCIFIYNNDGLHIEGTSSNKCRSNIFRDCTFRNNDDDGFYMEYGDKNKIENCTFKNNDGDGIELKQSGSTSSNKNEITNCNIRYNDNHGIYLYESSSNNTITNCNIHDNVQNGLHIEGPSSNKCEYNTITNCEIYDNDNDGVYLKYSEYNTIINCNIYDNGGDGIYLTQSKYNTISKCDIYNNDDYGASLTSSAKNNNIYNNKFIDNNEGNENAQDLDLSLTNLWYNGYPYWLPGGRTGQTGGNYWSDYDDEFDDPAAEDRFQGPRTAYDEPQTTDGSDGIADDSYPYANDWYPWCRRSVPYIFLPYYIDYWNPDGDSVILVNMDLSGYESKYIFLYYGYDGPLDESHNHTIGDVSLFFDDFSSSLQHAYPPLVKWDLYPNDNDIENNMSNSCVNLVDGEYIITKDFSIPTLGSPSPEPGEIPPYTITNESMYIIEARIKINNGQSNTFFLCQGGTKPWHKSYLVSADLTPLDKFYLHKEDGGEDKLDEVSMPDLDHWIRMKSYAYLSKTIYKPDYSTEYEDAVVTINGYLYNFTTFALEGNISGIDTNLIGTVPFMGGKIGLGCGLVSDENSNIMVDWIRVMKNPVVQPTVSIGPIESIDYGWTSNDVGATNRPSLDPFNPGPLLCDFNWQTRGRTFEIQNLPEDKYVITVTMGDTEEPCSSMLVRYNGNPGTTIPSTKAGEFETKWFTIDWSGVRNLQLQFSGSNWAVNYITIERGEKKDIDVATG